MGSICLIILAVNSFLLLSSAEISINGVCPSFDCCKEEFKPLSVEEMSGVWYLYGGAPFFFDADTKCTKVNVTSLSKNYFYMDAYQIETSVGRTRNNKGYGNFTADGKVTTLVSDLLLPLHYDIIQINTNFIIMFACSECGFLSKKDAGLHIYIYTRSKFPFGPMIDDINSKIMECGVSIDMIMKQDQISC